MLPAALVNHRAAGGGRWTSDRSRDRFAVSNGQQSIDRPCPNRQPPCGCGARLHPCATGPWPVAASPFARPHSAMTTSHRNLLRVGEQLGNLRLSRLIAEGGMGVLYEARHVLLGRAQAVKLLHPAFAHDATTCARFRLEAQVAASLDSDHVVPVREYGNADDGTPYFVMDLLEGVDLASLIATEAPLPVVRVADLILDACRGLRAAHEHEPPIIHRDLKPANLFVCQQDDGREVLKILDFGIAKLLDSLVTS